MKAIPSLLSSVAAVAAVLMSGPLSPLHAQGAESLKEGLVSYWPLDVVQGTKTPDLKSAYDLTLENLTEADLVAGRRGRAFSFNSARSTMLKYIAAAADELPINKHRSFTVAFWASADYRGQSDRRLFSEGSTTSNDPLFTIGTHSSATSGVVDLYIRQGGEQVNHVRTTAAPLDGSGWHHIVFVQEEKFDGSSARRIYVDGVFDRNFADKPGTMSFNMNTTTVGGIQRTSASHWITGLIDDVALWKRALTEPEITDLYQNGMPDLAPPVEPLVIRKFEADFDKVARGGTTTLRWDVSKDGTIVIQPGLGDVTAQSTFGVGSREVTVNQPVEYELTLSRGADPSVVRSFFIGTVDGVQPGWHWLEDFGGRQPGPLGNQAHWLAAAGVVNVSAVGETQAVSVTGGGDLTALELLSRELRNGHKATLFFRFCYSEQDAALPVDISVGLTEKPTRFVSDFNTNIGTYVHFDRQAGGRLFLQARNGPGAPYMDADFRFEPGRVYKVWIDVENRPLGESDVYSVHVAAEGEPRTTLFQDLLSDREDVDVPGLGRPKENINYLFLVARTGSQASQSLFFDDFYLSGPQAFAATVPVPSSFGKVVAVPAAFMITNVSYNPVISELTLEWNSQPGATYALQISSGLQSWTDIVAGIPSGGATTRQVITHPLQSPGRHFRIRRE